VWQKRGIGRCFRDARRHFHGSDRHVLRPTFRRGKPQM
jgi:hypothetical protein